MERPAQFYLPHSRNRSGFGFREAEQTYPQVRDHDCFDRDVEGAPRHELSKNRSFIEHAVLKIQVASKPARGVSNVWQADG